MQISYLWGMFEISNRKYKLLKIILDTILFSGIIYSLSGSYIFKSLSLSVLIIINYSSGYYDFYQKLNLKNFFYSFIKIGVGSAIVFIFIKLLDLENINLIGLKILSNFILSSWILQIVLNIFFYKKLKQVWINKSNQNYHDFLENDLKIIKHKFIFLNERDLEKKEKKINHVHGIICDKKDNLDLNFKQDNLSIISIYELYENNLDRIPPNLIGKNDSYILENIDNKKLYFFLKRINDILFSFLLIIFTLPILVITAFLIKLEDGGPIFYSQIRSGLKNKPYKIFKLRSMIVNAEKDGPQWSFINDSRLTRVGKVIRSLRIDEIPQLLSVIKGDMSLIGPRPERPIFIENLSKEIPHYSLRNEIKPGLSGWAQVNYPYGSSTLDAINKLSYDIYYLKKISLTLDLLIFFKTIRIVFNAKGT